MADFSDEELFSAANKGIYTFLSQRIKSGPITIEDCNQAQKQALVAFFKGQKTKYWCSLSQSEMRKVDSILERLKEPLRKEAEKILLKVQKSNTIAKICASSAVPLIQDFAQEHGLNLEYINAQTYRARISILLPKKKRLILYIRYKAVQEDLERVPQSVADATKMVEYFGHNLRIY